MTTWDNEDKMTGCDFTAEELANFVSTPAEEIADALEACDLRESILTTTQEMPAIPMAELVAASTYNDENLATAMRERAIGHYLVEEEANFNDGLEVTVRSSELCDTLSEVLASEEK